jgi:Tfp pilus assembly protein FimT
MAYVVFIAAIILAMTVPTFSKFVKGSRLNGTSNELMADIHFARSMAVSKRKQFHIEFDPQEYRIVETATSEVVRTRTVPSYISFAASADPKFYAWGLADPVNIAISGVGRTKNVDLSTNGSVSHY